MGNLFGKKVDTKVAALDTSIDDKSQLLQAYKDSSSALLRAIPLETSDRVYDKWPATWAKLPEQAKVHINRDVSNYLDSNSKILNAINKRIFHAGELDDHGSTIQPVSTDEIKTTLDSLREHDVDPITNIIYGILINAELMDQKPLSGVPQDQVRDFVAQFINPTSGAWESSSASGGLERVLGGDWSVSSKNPIKCVALALLIVGVIFLLAFWLFKISSNASTKSAGTLVGCGFMSAAVVTVGLAWFVAE